MNIKNEIAAVDNLPSQQIAAVTTRIQMLHSVFKKHMQEGVHYGIIPGCNKPSLWKPGAELICTLFQLSPRFELTLQKESDGSGHREYIFDCSLHSPDNALMGEGAGSCSTMESKYKYRTAARNCPECGKETIIKGKAEYGGGWLCFAKKGGCGAKWADGSPEIEKQVQGKIDNPDIADYYNTCLKMAKKRAFIDAVLTCTSCSDIFTQDVEDLPEFSSRAPQERVVTEDEKPASDEDGWLASLEESLR